VPVHPTEEQIRQLVARSDDGPVVMLNLLRFKEHADGIDEGVSGAEAYARYSTRTPNTSRSMPTAKRHWRIRD
jgi:hypothetical protein